MIISVTKERYDAYWEDFDEETSYYWVTNPRVARRITRLETKVEASSDRAIVMYNVLQAVKYIIIPLMLFIISLALGGHAQQWIVGGIAGLVFAGVFFGITYFLDWINWVDGYGGPGDGSSRRRRLSRKAARIGSKTKDSDRIPVSRTLGHLYDNPETRLVMLEHSSEITRLLVEGEVTEARMLLDLPDSEIDSDLRRRLSNKIDVVENNVINLIRETIAARELTQAEKAQDEALARKAGNNIRAKLLLNETDAD